MSRKRLYEEAGLVFETSAGLSHTEAFDALFAREKLGSACLFGNKPLRNALLHAESEVKICELIHNWTPPVDLHYEPDFSEDDEDA